MSKNKIINLLDDIIPLCQFNYIIKNIKDRIKKIHKINGCDSFNTIYDSSIKQIYAILIIIHKDLLNGRISPLEELYNTLIELELSFNQNIEARHVALRHMYGSMYIKDRRT